MKTSRVERFPPGSSSYPMTPEGYGGVGRRTRFRAQRGCPTGSPPGKGYNYYSLCTVLLRPWPEHPGRQARERTPAYRAETSIATAGQWGASRKKPRRAASTLVQPRGCSSDELAREPKLLAARCFRDSTSN